MRSKALLIGLALVVASASFSAAQSAKGSAVATSTDLLAAPRDVKWGPAPPMVPSGAQAAILSGNPMQDGSPYTLGLKMPAGYKIGPHWHPTDENVTVLNGTLGIGMGDKFDEKTAHPVHAGGFVRAPQGCTITPGPKVRRRFRFMA